MVTSPLQRGRILGVLRVPFQRLGDAIPFDEVLNWYRSSVESRDSVLEAVENDVWRACRVKPFETVGTSQAA